MKVAHSFETSIVNNRATQHNISEDVNPQWQHCANLRALNEFHLLVNVDAVEFAKAYFYLVNLMISSVSLTYIDTIKVASCRLARQ
jgi:hypothetical protein